MMDGEELRELRLRDLEARVFGAPISNQPTNVEKKNKKQPFDISFESMKSQPQQIKVEQP